jgi:hypothetical protein
MFSLDKDQLKKLEEWMQTHKKVYTGAIGGRYTYSFTPTSLAVIVKVKDGITNEEIDLTDYTGW